MSCYSGGTIGDTRETQMIFLNLSNILIKLLKIFFLENDHAFLI